MTKERKYHVGDEGRKLIGRIISIKGHCTYGQKVGDEFELSAQSTGDICPYFYHNLYPYIMTYQFGGKFPESWGGECMEFLCPDILNQVRIQLRPEGTDSARHLAYLKDEENEEKKWRKKLGID